MTSPQPGERKLRILQALAGMLETPKGEKITTAALAARLECSEAALYRHFASKAQMYEGLIDFIETSLFTVINQIAREESTGQRQAELIINLLLGFAEKNRGMTRVLIGEALTHENERLQIRINALLDKVESALRQSLRLADLSLSQQTTADQANLLLCFVLGRWQRYVKHGFSRSPLDHWPQQWAQLATMLRSAE